MFDSFSIARKIVEKFTFNTISSKLIDIKPYKTLNVFSLFFLATSLFRHFLVPTLTIRISSFAPHSQFLQVQRINLTRREDKSFAIYKYSILPVSKFEIEVLNLFQNKLKRVFDQWIVYFHFSVPFKLAFCYHLLLFGTFG